MSNWVAHYSAEGRPYWFNSESKESVWEKPRELQSAVEIELGNLNWKEYETKGRKYWVHNISKETTWEMPAEVRDVMSRSTSSIPSGPSYASPSQSIPAPATLLPAPGFLPSRPNVAPPPLQIQQLQPIPQSLTPIHIQIPIQQQVLPEYQTHAEAERAFMTMLSEVGVTVDWTWERTMRETIVNPFYKVLKSLAERKTAFEAYINELHEAEAAARKSSLDKARKGWMSAMERLGGGDEERGIQSWWSWEKGAGELEKRMSPPEVWNNVRNDEERRTLFNEFIAAKKLREVGRLQSLRVENLAKLANIFQSLSLDLAGPLRWREVHSTILSTQAWQSDPNLQRIAQVDILAAYEEELNKAEREQGDERRRVGEEKRRRNRKAREAFVTLLHELKAAGHITPLTTWKSLYPLVESSPAYDNLLGVPGSSPIDLFWDVLDEVERQADNEQVSFEKIMEENNLGVQDDDTYDTFVERLERDERLAKFDYFTIKTVFDRLHARALRIKKEERRKAEKRVRIQIDDLRYAFKKLDPPVDLEASYEDTLPRIEDTPEFKIMEDDSARRIAFEKFIKRQKEKAKEKERAPSPANEVEDNKRSSRSSRKRDDERSSSKRDREDVKKEEDEMTSADTEMPKEATEEKAVKEEEEKEEKPRVNKRARSAAGSGGEEVDSEAEEGEIE